MENDVVETELLQEIEQFCEQSEISLTDFGRHSVNDSALVTTLRKGRELRSATRMKIRDYITEKVRQSEQDQTAAG